MDSLFSSSSLLQGKQDLLAGDSFFEWMSQNFPAPTYYAKGRESTKDLIPACKTILARGGTCLGVYVHRNDSSLVIKKAKRSLLTEYALGRFLSHSHIVRIHTLFIKQYQQAGIHNVHKLVMEKVKGNLLESWLEPTSKWLSKKTITKLITQARDCCLYLFERGVFWADLSPTNVFVTEDRQELKLIDLGAWKIETDDKNKFQELLTGANELIEWILEAGGISQTQAIRISLPKIFFGEKMSSFKFIMWLSALEPPQDPEDQRELLKCYFASVLSKLEAANCFHE